MLDSKLALVLVVYGALLPFLVFADERNIVGRWLCDEPDLRFVLEFHSDGTLENISLPGPAQMSFLIDFSGTPAELKITYVLDETKIQRQLWVDFLSYDAIQIRSKETDSVVFGQKSSTTFICERFE